VRVPPRSVGAKEFLRVTNARRAKNENQRPGPDQRSGRSLVSKYIRGKKVLLGSLFFAMRGNCGWVGGSHPAPSFSSKLPLVRKKTCRVEAPQIRSGNAGPDGPNRGFSTLRKVGCSDEGGDVLPQWIPGSPWQGKVVSYCTLGAIDWADSGELKRTPKGERRFG